MDTRQGKYLKVCNLARHNHNSRHSRKSRRFTLAVAIVGLVVVSSASSSETNGAGETSTATTAQSADDAIAHWALEEGTGTAAMDSVNGLVATLAPRAAWASGRFGSGVALDGASGYVGAPIIDVTGSAPTLAAWVKIDGYPGRTEQRIISKATGSSQQAHYWMLGQVKSRGKNRLQFQLKTGNTTTRLVATTGELPTGAWFHAAATYDGAYVRLFLDGEEVGRTAKSGLLATDASAPVDIGRSPDGSNYLRGTIDDVRIYGRALGAGEIASIMDGPGESPNEPPSVQLTSPASGATFTAPATIALTAAASRSGAPAVGRAVLFGRYAPRHRHDRAVRFHLVLRSGRFVLAHCRRARRRRRGSDVCCRDDHRLGAGARSLAGGLHSLAGPRLAGDQLTARDLRSRCGPQHRHAGRDVQSRQARARRERRDLHRSHGVLRSACGGQLCSNGERRWRGREFPK
jgi:hypothetical protein